MLPWLTNPTLSAFINCCGNVGLHSMTPSAGQHSPRGARGAIQLQLRQGSVRGHVSSVCFCFFLCLLGHARPCSFPTDCAAETLLHTIIIITITTIIPPTHPSTHRKPYCMLNKHFSFLMITGCTVAYCSRVSVSVFKWLIQDC